MLCTAVQHGHRHLGGTQQRALFLETVVAQPYQVVQRFIDGIDTLVACGMPTLSSCYAVNHHQTFLGNGRAHACRLTHDGHINLRQFGKCQTETIVAAHLLFTRCQVHQVVTGSVWRDFIAPYPVYLQQADQSATTVVGAQTIEPVPFHDGIKRIARPGRHRFHRVDVCIQQQGLLRRIELLLNENIVADAPVRHSPLPDEIG